MTSALFVVLGECGMYTCFTLLISSHTDTFFKMDWLVYKRNGKKCVYKVPVMFL